MEEVVKIRRSVLPLYLYIYPTRIMAIQHTKIITVLYFFMVSERSNDADPRFMHTSLPHRTASEKINLLEGVAPS
jgi:hypothetical protein